MDKIRILLVDGSRILLEEGLNIMRILLDNGPNNETTLEVFLEEEQHTIEDPFRDRPNMQRILVEKDQGFSWRMDSTP